MQSCIFLSAHWPIIHDISELTLQITIQINITSAQKLAASKRTMSSLTNNVKKRKASVRSVPEPLRVEMRP